MTNIGLSITLFLIPWVIDVYLARLDAPITNTQRRKKVGICGTLGSPSREFAVFGQNQNGGAEHLILTISSNPLSVVNREPIFLQDRD